MAKEIERKFIAKNAVLKLLPQCERQSIVQGYLHEKGMTSRVRIVDGSSAWLTFKGPRQGLARDEFEYPIPLADGLQLLRYCDARVLRKTRHTVPFAGWSWCVDVFHGELTGLVLAEVELPSEKAKVTLPPWVATEVTLDKRFSNKNLASARRTPLRLAA